MNQVYSLLTGTICLFFGILVGTVALAHTLNDDSPSESRLQLLDVKAELNARMLKETNGPVLISTKKRLGKAICRTCYAGGGGFRSNVPRDSCDRRCSGVYHPEIIVVNKAPLTIVGEVDLIPQAITYSEPEVYGIPTQISSQTLEHINCDHIGESSISETVAFSTTITTSTTFSKSITNSKSHTLSLQAQFGVPGVGQGGASASRSISTSVNITDGNIQSTTENFSRNVHVSARAAPYTKLIAYTIGHVWKGHVHFEASVVADANVMKNEIGKSRVSNVLNINDRTFVVVGILTTDVVTNVKSRKTTLPYDCRKED